MSLALRFHRLFRVRVLEQGTGLQVPGISIRPLRRTRQVMADYRLLFKAVPAGFDVVFRTNPDAGNAVTSPISAANPVVLSFALTVKAATALAAYEPPGQANRPQQFYLDNLLADGSLHPGADSPMSTGPAVSNNDGVRIHGHEFRLAAGDINGAATLQIRHLVSNLVALPQPLDLGNPQVESGQPAIDMRHSNPGPYRVVPAPGSNSKIYIDDELVRGNTVAAIDVHWRTPQDPAAQVATYVVSFKKKAG